MKNSVVGKYAKQVIHLFGFDYNKILDEDFYVEWICLRFENGTTFAFKIGLGPATRKEVKAKVEGIQSTPLVE